MSKLTDSNSRAQTADEMRLTARTTIQKIEPKNKTMINRKLKQILRDGQKHENRSFLGYKKEEYLDESGIPTLKHNKILHEMKADVCQLKHKEKHSFFNMLKSHVVE